MMNVATHLCTLQFTHIPAKGEDEQQAPAIADKDAKSETADDAAAAQARAEARKEADLPDIPDFRPTRSSQLQFGDWSLLCRILFVTGDGAGAIQGSVKVRSPQGSSGEAAASGSRVTIVASESSWRKSPDYCGDVFGGDSTFDFLDMMSVTLSISVNRLDGAVVGLPGELHNVVIRCEGHEVTSTVVGDASVILSNGTVLKLAKPWRFVLRQYKGARCAKCLDPVETIGYNCHCSAVEYCSRACQDSHVAGHALLCQTLKDYATPKGGRCTATFAGMEFPVYWRCTEGTAFKVLVDSNNPLGRPYELCLDVMKDAREGLSLTFLAPESAPISDAELNALNVSVFQAIFSDGLKVACDPLLVIALNHLFVFCDNAEILAPFFSTFIEHHPQPTHHGEGVRQVNSLAEYVMLTRPVYEGACVAIESALRSNLAVHYCNNLSAAKSALAGLHSLNFDVSFPSSLSAVQAKVVAAQQRETLRLLAKTFILHAVRAPQEESHHFLRRAEECYKDSIDEDKNRNDLMNMGKTCLQLATLYLLFQTPAETIKAKIVKDQGVELIALAKKGQRQAAENAAKKQAAAQNAAAAAAQLQAQKAVAAN